VGREKANEREGDREVGGEKGKERESKRRRERERVSVGGRERERVSLPSLRERTGPPMKSRSIYFAGERVATRGGLEFKRGPIKQPLRALQKLVRV